MSSMQQRQDARLAGAEASPNGWATRVFLQPIAAPSILGLAGFSGATLIVAMNMAGWFGNATTPIYLWPFCLAFGGLAQFAAGMWSYRARDAIATLAHGTWGAFWIGYGVFWAFVSAHVITMPKPAAPMIGFGLWFVPLAYVTLTAAVAALGESLGIFLVLFTLGAGSAMAAGGLMSGGLASEWTKAAGWVFVASAAAAWYVVTAMLLMAATGRTVLPTGELKKRANVPGRKPIEPIELEWAEPGVKQGQ